MFDYAFSQYSMHSIYKPGEVLGIVKVQKGTVPEISIQADKDYSVLVKKGVKVRISVMRFRWTRI